MVRRANKKQKEVFPPGPPVEINKPIPDALKALQDALYHTSIKIVSCPMSEEQIFDFLHFDRNKELGRGSYGVVLGGKIDQVDVAVKLQCPAMPGDPYDVTDVVPFLDQLKNELTLYDVLALRVLATPEYRDHVTVPSKRYILATPGLSFIVAVFVMSVIDGTLEQYVKKYPNKMVNGKVVRHEKRSWYCLSRFMNDWYKGLEVVHSVNYIYVDAKPNNTYYKVSPSENQHQDTEEHFGLVDFGLSVPSHKSHGSDIKIVPPFGGPDFPDWHENGLSYQPLTQSADVYSGHQLARYFTDATCTWGEEYNAKRETKRRAFLILIWRETKDIFAVHFHAIISASNETRPSARAALKHPYLTMVRDPTTLSRTLWDLHRICNDEGLHDLKSELPAVKGEQEKEGNEKKEATEKAGEKEGGDEEEKVGMKVKAAKGKTPAKKTAGRRAKKVTEEEGEAVEEGTAKKEEKKAPAKKAPEKKAAEVVEDAAEEGGDEDPEEELVKRAVRKAKPPAQESETEGEAKGPRRNPRRKKEDTSKSEQKGKGKQPVEAAVLATPKKEKQTEKYTKTPKSVKKCQDSAVTPAKGAYSNRFSAPPPEFAERSIPFEGDLAKTARCQYVYTDGERCPVATEVELAKEIIARPQHSKTPYKSVFICRQHHTNNPKLSGHEMETPPPGKYMRCARYPDCACIFPLEMRIRKNTTVCSDVCNIIGRCHHNRTKMKAAAESDDESSEEESDDESYEEDS